MQEEQGYNQDNWDCLCGSKQVYFTLSKTNSEVENRNFDPKMIEILSSIIENLKILKPAELDGKKL